MIICHCNRLGNRDIEAASDRLVTERGCGGVSPTAVYHCLGKRPKCGGCLSVAAMLIQERHGSFTAAATSAAGAASKL